MIKKKTKSKKHEAKNDNFRRSKDKIPPPEYLKGSFLAARNSE